MKNGIEPGLMRRCLIGGVRQHGQQKNIEKACGVTLPEYPHSQRTRIEHLGAKQKQFPFRPEEITGRRFPGASDRLLT